LAKPKKVIMQAPTRNEIARGASFGKTKKGYDGSLHVKPPCISLHKDFAILCTLFCKKRLTCLTGGIFHGNKRINILMSFNDGCLGILNRNDV
jgi:hypothetical protein